MSVQSYARFCPVGFIPEDVQTNSSIQEITLKPGKQDDAKSWIVDNIIESQEGNYASQEDVWRDFLLWLNQCSDASQLTCMTIGPPRSGKSYTLFGSNTSPERGIIPRFLEHVFVEQHALGVEISMCLCRGETLIDVLDPPASYPTMGSVIHSSTLGPCIVPLKVSVQGGIAGALHVLRLGYVAASVVLLNTSDPFSCSDFIVRIRVATPQKRYTITFIDASPLILFSQTTNYSSDTADRLSGINLHHAAASALIDCGIGAGANCSSAAKIRGNRLQQPYERSLLTYLLQDTLLRAQHTCVIGHIRSSIDWFGDNAAVLSFLESIHDACEVIRMTETENASTNMISSRSVLAPLLHAELELLASQKSESNVPEQSRYHEFVTMKYQYLEQANHRANHIAAAIRDCMEDAIPITRWLKHRGIPSAYLDAKNHLCGAWSMSKPPVLTHPVLIPTAPSHFIDLIVHFPLNVGHTAFCGKEIHIGRDIIGARFDKIFQDICNNCRVYPLGTAGMKEAHAVIFRMGNELKLRSCGDAIVEVNGHRVTDELIISDGDVISLGIGCLFALQVPAALDDEEEAELEVAPIILPTTAPCFSETHFLQSMQPSLYDIVAHALTERNIRAHYAVQRDMIPVTRQTEMTDDMKLLQFEPDELEVESLLETINYSDRLITAQTIFATSLANFYATELGRNVVYDAQLRLAAKKKGSPSENRGQRRVLVGKYDFSLDVLARGTNSDGKIGTGGWTWNFVIFNQRILLMDACYAKYVIEFNKDIDKYDETSDANTDPFIDPTDFELIGVSYVHLDSLNFLLDVNDTAPIITFKGVAGGAVKLSMRCWIDKVEPVPPYISIDKESVLSDFMNRKCIIRLHIDSCQGINAALSTEVYCAFKFFCHASEYRTARVRNNATPTPFLNTVVVLEQLVTPEFISYIQRRSLELEIYGCRASTVTAASSRYHVQHFVGEITLENIAIAADESVGGASLVDDASSLSPAEEVEVLKKELQQLTEMLNQTERSNRRATRVVDTLKSDTPAKKGLLDEKKRLETKLNAEIAKTMELEQRLQELQETITRAEEEKVKKAQKSRACTIS